MALGDFTQQAGEYARSRPSYPPELVEVLVREAHLKSGDLVADIGAGTGIFTRQLLQLGLNVVAVEPNATMRAEAGELAASWVQGSFEQTGLDSQSISWAVAAQAFHWAKPAQALPEIHRILKPGATFTVLWNQRNTSRSALLQWVDRYLLSAVPHFAESYVNQPWNKILESTGDFDYLRTQTADHTILMSRDRFLSLWKSHNRLGTLAGPETLAQFLLALEAELMRHFPEELAIPYFCEAWTARRL